MLTDNQLWHARVGFLNSRLNNQNKTPFPSYLSNDVRLIYILPLYFQSSYQLCGFLLLSVLLYCLYIKNFILLKSQDIESNPGSRKSSVLKFCCWNLNGLAAHELSLIEGYKNINDIDVICLSETFLISSMPIDDNRYS